MSGHITRRVTKTRGSRWRVVVEAGFDQATGERRRITRQGFATKKEAEQALRRILTSLEDGTYVERAELTVGEFLVEEWLPVHRRTIRDNTADSYRVVITAYVVPQLGLVKLQRLRPRHLNQLYAELAESGGGDHKGLSAKSIRNVHGVLRRALDDAVRWELIPRNPAMAASVPRLNGGEQRHRTWDADQLGFFLASLPDDDLVALWTLAATTGMRRSELLGLQWRDLDLDAGHLSVVRTVVPVSGGIKVSEPKTPRSARRIQLDPETVAVLRRHRYRVIQELLAADETDVADGFVFARPDGSPLRPAYVSRRFRRLAQAAGLPRIRFHDLRHSWATIALGSDIHPKVVADRLGHANIGITLNTYSHVVPTVQTQAAEAVASSIFGT